MHSIQRHLLYDDKFHELRISEPAGMAGVYQIFIDKFYQGTIGRYKGEWVGRLNRDPVLTDKDVQNIGRLIEEEGWLREAPTPGPAR